MKNKKETIGEFIKEELEDIFFTNISKRKEAERLIELGAKWQQERMYSEKDMIAFGNKMQIVSDVDFDGNIKFAFNPSEYFEKFKNNKNGK